MRNAKYALGNDDSWIISEKIEQYILIFCVKFYISSVNLIQKNLD